MSNPLKIVIADDNRFFAEALKDSLEKDNNIKVLKIFNDIESLINYTTLMVFDLLILDVNFNGITSLDYIEKIRIEKKDFKIIALTTLNNNYIKTKATLKGVDIFIGKDSNLSIFPKIIKDCVENNKNDSFKLSSKIEIENIFFTSRKIEVLQKLYQYSNKTEKEIAGILCISVSALKTHKQEMFSLTNTKNTLELIKFGIEKGLILI